ncbi:MAG: hypothetical protein OEU09_08350 [Rhodospirillales bacterium]|nr:hypothetical protein [Rhodospirillales bacterium]MDH3911293.1 hypothetical protein [Rhodospirillales bacterium]MDH3917053.1 hypothetical protein [Rhodospirillales bacterium]MDH3968017.1 hypothetical protein [Rhodospirillales bacterium]
MEPVFFLKSKRFWSMPVSYGVGWVVAKLATLGFEIPAGEAEAVISMIVAGIVWLVGMVLGQRPVALTPKKEVHP